MRRQTACFVLQELDGFLAGRDWVLGSDYSVADPYTLVIYGWGRGHRMPSNSSPLAREAMRDRLADA